jgi:iron complex transport system substrate-binding protein
MGSSAAGLQQIRDAGITVLVVNDATDFDKVYDSIGMIGKATGKVAEAETIVSDMKAKIEEIKSKVASIKAEDKKNVYVEISESPDIMAAGKNTFIDEILNTVQANNIITEEGWPKIDQEAVIASNPDVIITTYGFYIEDPVGTITSREGWQDMNAVKNKQVVDVNSDKVTRPGPRLVEGVEEVAKAVYPDLFN